MSAAQEKILHVIEDENHAKVLANVWQMIEGAPLQAAKVLRGLEQSTEAVAKVAAEIPEAWKRLDDQALEVEVRRQQFIEDLRTFRKDTLVEMTAMADAFRGLKSALDSVDEDKVLNKANRLIEVADKLARMKKDGTLETIKHLLQ
jgi:hypothetical protein